MHPALRLLLEAIAAAVGLLALFAGAVVILQFGPSALWVACYALATGIVPALFAGFLVGRRSVPGRLRFDLWLAAWIPAAAIVGWMFAARWPIRGKSMNAHGFGTSGGEANAMLLPAVQALVFVAALLVVARSRRSGAGR